MRQTISPKIWRTTVSRTPHSVPVVDISQFTGENSCETPDDSACDCLEPLLRALISDHPILAAILPR